MATRYKYEDQLKSDRLFTRFLKPGDISVWSNFFKDKDATAFFPAAPNIGLLLCWLTLRTEGETTNTEKLFTAMPSAN